MQEATARTHIRNDLHYSDRLQKEVDRKGTKEIPKEAKENGNADDCIESEGGHLEGSVFADEHGHSSSWSHPQPHPLTCVCGRPR